MKKSFFYLLFISLLFSSCEKEEDNNNPIDINSSLSCLIDGDNFSTNNVEILNTSFPLSISATSSLGKVVLNFKLMIPNEGEKIIFSLPDYARVELNNYIYSNTYWGPPFEGEVLITEKKNGLISGEFFFKANDVNTINQIPIYVTQGSFSNIMYE